LAEGAIEEVRTRVLRDQLGKKVAAQADVDFDGPMMTRDELSAERKIPFPHPEEPRGRRGVSKGEGPGLHPRIKSGAGSSRADSRPPQEEERRPGKPRPWRGRGRERPIVERAPETDAPRKLKAGLVTDRKGRRVLVQRVQAETSVEVERSAPRGRQHRKPSRDRRHGPRPSRPRSPGGDERN
jgi:23S rRNA pseudouridine2605 synthase